MNYSKVENAVLYFLNRSRDSVPFIHIAKYLYYVEAYFYQHYGQTFLDTDYLHIGVGPYPMYFYEALHQMSRRRKVALLPDIQDDKLLGFRFEANTIEKMGMFSRREKAVLRIIAYAFRNGLQKEVSEFPNLYQNYVATDLFQQIDLKKKPIPKKTKMPRKPFLIRKNSLLYRIFFD